MTTQIVSGAVIGVVVAVASAWVSHLLTLKRERERWEREDQRQREAWDQETQLKHRDDRVALYKTLADVSRVIQPTLTKEERAAAAAQVAQGSAEIRLLASEEVYNAAHDLYDAVTAFRISTYLLEVSEDSEEFEVADQHSGEIRKAREKLATPYRAFVTAARKELDVDVMPSKTP